MDVSLCPPGAPGRRCIRSPQNGVVAKSAGRRQRFLALGVRRMEPRELSQAYAGFVRRQCGADGVAVLEFHRLTGGAIQNNYALTVDLAGAPCTGPKAREGRSAAHSWLWPRLDRPQG